MDSSFHQLRSETQRPNILSASLQIFDSTLHWLAGLIQLTEDEQEAAGIYLGHHG